MHVSRDLKLWFAISMGMMGSLLDGTEFGLSKIRASDLDHQSVADDLRAPIRNLRTLEYSGVVSGVVEGMITEPQSHNRHLIAIPSGRRLSIHHCDRRVIVGRDLDATTTLVVDGKLTIFRPFNRFLEVSKKHSGMYENGKLVDCATELYLFAIGWLPEYELGQMRADLPKAWQTSGPLLIDLLKEREVIDSKQESTISIRANDEMIDVSIDIDRAAPNKILSWTVLSYPFGRTHPEYLRTHCSLTNYVEAGTGVLLPTSLRRVIQTVGKDGSTRLDSDAYLLVNMLSVNHDVERLMNILPMPGTITKNYDDENETVSSGGREMLEEVLPVAREYIRISRMQHTAWSSLGTIGGWSFATLGSGAMMFLGIGLARFIRSNRRSATLHRPTTNSPEYR